MKYQKIFNFHGILVCMGIIAVGIVHSHVHAANEQPQMAKPAFERDRFPDLEASSEDAAGYPIMIELGWGSLADAGRRGGQ